MIIKLAFFIKIYNYVLSTKFIIYYLIVLLLKIWKTLNK